jgi:glycosyltransferase involved in cell wall biosynthesis
MQSMEKIIIKGEKKTPYINFDPDNRQLHFEGRSIPEDTIRFYEPILKWIENYVEYERSEPTDLHINLEYFNTSTSRYLFGIFKILESYHLKGNPVLIHWYYERDDFEMLESGEDYASILKIPFKMVPVEVEE